MLPDTHLERFAKQDGKWINQHGETKAYVLEEKEDGFLLTIWEEGKYKAYRFDKTGRLTAVSHDPFSRRETRITYAGQGGQIKCVTSPGGHTLQFRYEREKLVQVTDETGRTLSYEYEGDFLVSASYPTGGKQTYIHDENGRIVTMDGWDGRDFLSNQYDDKGRVICQTYPDGNTCSITYDDRHQETWFTFSDTGRWEHYYCDHQDHVLRTERGCGGEARKQSKPYRRRPDTEAGRLLQPLEHYRKYLWKAMFLMRRATKYQRRIKTEMYTHGSTIPMDS